MIILYPSYSFETLSTDRTATEAGELLASWTAAFHPALIERFNEIPRWESASIPPYDASKQPLLIPPCCESFMSEDWFGQQEEGGTVLLRNLHKREDILAALFKTQDIAEHGFDEEYVADFFALGTTYFLVDLLVRQMHYMSMMDDSQTTTQIFDSLKAYRAGDHEKARDHLKQAFEAVCQSKEYFYPIQWHFVDLTLVTPTTTGEAFREGLEHREQANLFLSSRLLETLPEIAPESFAALKSACESGKLRFVVDDPEEKPLMLLPILDLADRVLEGISIYRDRLNVSPAVYGRLTTGMTPVLPQILKLAGMKGAIHFAPLDGWRIKDEAQSKIIWQGVDGTKLDALVRYPLDGSSDLDFFALASRLGETVNNDQAPTAVFARFPNRDRSWLDDLHRMSRYASQLGTFSDLERYFDDTPRCGGVQNFAFGKYPCDVLSTSVAAGQADPISSWNAVCRQNADRAADSAVQTLLSLLRCPPSDRTPVERLAGAVTGRTASAESNGIVVVNPWSFPRRVFLDVSHWNALPAERSPVVLARESGDKKEIAVDVPPLGYAYVEPPEDGEATAAEKSSQKPGGLLGFFKSSRPAPEPDLVSRAEDVLDKKTRRTVFLLRNEFFEAKIDATTGMLRSVFTDGSRFNRLSRQLGYRLPKEGRAEDTRNPSDPNRGYAIMAADDISIDSTGPLTGRLTTRGRLVCQDGSVAATFRETVTVRRKSRVLEFDLSLEPVAKPGEIPWDSYYAVRWAWNDNTLDLRGCLADGAHPLSADRLHAPRFVDLRGEKLSLTFLTEGLPFHRRLGERQLDTILVARGETARSFRYGIGVDLALPVPASLEFAASKDDWAVPVSGRPKSSSSWLFRVEAKNVVALYWEPLLENETPVGFRVFLLETEGRRAHFALHSFLPPVEAAAADLFGEEEKEFKIDSDCVLLDMHGRELLPLVVRFEKSKGVEG